MKEVPETEGAIQSERMPDSPILTVVSVPGPGKERAAGAQCSDLMTHERGGDSATPLKYT